MELLELHKMNANKKPRKFVTRSTNILEIIHTFICCPDMSLNGQEYSLAYMATHDILSVLAS